MNPSKIDLILKSKLSQRDVKLNDTQTIAVREAMMEYGIHLVESYRSNETKAVSLEAVSFFPALLKGEIKLWFRKISFKRAKKIAISRASIERLKMYVVRVTDIKYMVFSTNQIDHLKKLKKFKKNVDFRALSEVSDFIAFPPK